MVESPTEDPRLLLRRGDPGGRMMRMGYQGWNYHSQYGKIETVLNHQPDKDV